MGGTYSRTIDGVTYTVRFYNPFHSSASNNRMLVHVLIFADKWWCGAQYDVTMVGMWKMNSSQSTPTEESYTWSFGSFGSLGLGGASGVMKDYSTLYISGNLPTGYNSVTLGSYTGATTSGLKWSDDLTSYKTYSNGESSFENQEINFSERSDYYNSARKYVEYIIENNNYSPSGFDQMSPTINMKYYQWYVTYVDGFIRAKANPTATVENKWEKKIKLSWEKEGSNTNGTWSIYRYKTNDGASSRELLVENLTYLTTNYTVSMPTYDEEYSYEIAFIPTEGQRRDELTRTVSLTMERNWDIKIESVKVYDDSKLKVQWSHSSIEDASSKNYQLMLQRSEDSITWATVETFNITSSQTVDGNYVDGTDLTANHTYYYRLKITVMDNEYITTPMGTKLGGSKILSFSATRGSYSNMVKLQWQVKQVGTNTTNFIIQRRPLGSDDAWTDIHTTSGTASGYSYDDVTALPGSYNEYRVVVWSQDETNKKTYDDSMITDGFSVTTGMISGNITFDTGTAVEGVKVTLKQQNTDGEISSGMRSLRLNGFGSGMTYACDTTELKKLMGKDFSIQMYLNPDSAKMNVENQRYLLIDVVSGFTLWMKYNKSAASYTLGTMIGKSDIVSDVTIPAGAWSHITCVRNNTDKNVSLYVVGTDIQGEDTVSVLRGDTIAQGKEITWDLVVASKDSCMAIGNSGNFDYDYYYDGYLDEFRFFTKALKPTEILKNYNHPLAGNESGLAIYYPFDEGLALQKLAYDLSKTNGAGNGRHATAKVAAESSTYTPNEKQLSLMAYTDVNGYYEVRGIPFSGEGTSYSVIPTLGIHEFSPTLRSRYVSMSTLNHSGVDFEDISSFPVSGKIFYAGTDYPVEGVSLAVDGISCAKDGEPVVTDENGEFEISVPIGDHFISVSKAYHEFANNGRYPVDPNNVGTRYTFNKAVKNLDFIDETLVNFSGRVVGGDIEGEKTIGFGLSQNNIGETELVLTPLNTLPRMNVVKQVSETTYSYETNTETVAIASASSKVKSKSWRGAGTDDCRKLIIRTDPETGEFSAMVPPVQYMMNSMTVLNNANVDFGVLPTIDMSNVGLSYSDTLSTESGADEVFTYNYQLRQTYHSTPSFNVSQSDHTDGAFGISYYKMVDLDGGINIDDIYTINASGQPEYKYGGAMFEMNEPYTFNLEAYEEYVNNDGTTPVTDKVPLKDLVVTIDNALSDGQSVYSEDGTVDGQEVKAGEVVQLQSNQLQLDSLGKGTYKWHAGLPNISEPYTRTIAMSYDIDGRHYLWSGSGMTGVVLGSMPTGNNFVTSGPDLIDMVLRDPPGSGSSAEWSSGTVTSHSEANLGTWSSENHLTTTAKMGVKFSTAQGFPAVAVISDIQSLYDLEVGIIANVEGEAGNTWSRTVETTKTISTSDAMDYVGAQGDIFVGSATNIIFGLARNLGFYRKGTSSEAELRLEDIVTTGLSFGTEFVYTQNYIENVLIPNLEALRNSLLKTVSDVNGQTCDGDRPIYVTTLSPGDEGYGANNPPYVYTSHTEWGDITYEKPCSDGTSYKMIVPDENESYEDSVLWCNTQIEAWKKHLAANEREKVRAYQLRNNTDSVEYNNYSFDSGSSITNSVETENTTSYKYDVQAAAGVHLNRLWGTKISETGILFDLGTETTAGYHREDEDATSTKTGFSYTLKEDGSDDALTVDVYKYGAFGPIFRTRGGQTSAPYEGQEVTKYYEPGTVIMDATMQIEKPDIEVAVNEVSDIPTGSAANYTLSLANNTEVGADVAYKIFVLDETNPYGAQLSIDGNVLTEGRLIKVPANQTLTKVLQLRQTDVSILEYEGNMTEKHDLYKRGIGIVFASESQPEDIADTVFIKAFFVPSSSEVDLALSTTTMNTQTGNTLKLTFSGFDRNYNNLKAFRLQFKPQGASNWSILTDTETGRFLEYVADSVKYYNSTNFVLPKTGSSVTYPLDMTKYTDGTYQFRAVSVATYGSEEVYRYSDEITLMKDMARPRPLGQPNPTDGVLDIGDELSITFNETILKGKLTQEQNFRVTGVLNGATVQHETALSMQNSETTAQTEADIMLAGKSFSIDTWVNLTGQGTILSHGAGSQKFTVSTDASNHLVVSIGSETYTSSNTVPNSKWAFLTLSYQPTDTGADLNASVATDAETITLFSDKSTVNYEGNGPLTVGKNMTGAIHELLLWDEAHDMTTALLNRSVTKNPATRHLIGYWKMNEGEGTQIRDYSRNRHLTMSEETWYLNNVNKAVTLDGASYISAQTADLPIFSDDDYAIEFWMRGDTQTGEAQLLQMGDVALSTATDGSLQLIGVDAYKPTDQTTPLATTSGNILNNAWHHVALNVLRQGAVAVYVDGQRVLTTNPANVGSIATNKIILGAKRTTISAENAEYSFDLGFKGQIDDVRIWTASMTANQLSANRKVRLTGSEDGLALYFPFEKKQLDSNNQVETVGNDQDLVSGDDTHNAQLFAFTSTTSEAPSYTDEAPAMRTKPTETNVSYNFTASDDKIVIELDEDATSIEGTTINFTVLDLIDENGNYSKPATWSAFINQKELVWDEDALSIEVPVTEKASITATIVNKSGTSQMWTLSGMPSWLTASAEYGTTNPLESTDVTFTVSEATAIGKYEETIYLKSNNGIETPLTISVNVTSEKPLWSVNPGDFEHTMNLIGNVSIADVMSEDEDDIVGAFINDECRGVASPEYSSRYDSYFVTMDIFGNGSDDDKAVEFKVFDASSGLIYPVVKAYLNGQTTATDIKFETNDLIGRYGTPTLLAATDEIEQEIELNKGWNWMSLSVKPDYFTVPNVFAKANDLVDLVKSSSKVSQFDEGIWLDEIATMNNKEMYAVHTTDALTLNVTGHRVVSSNEPISVTDGWTWVAFNSLSVMSLADALADMIPVDDEIIKGHRGVAYYDNHEWAGSLKQLVPGQGYKIQGKSARTFTYPTLVNGQRQLNALINNDVQPDVATIFTPADYHRYPTNMVVIAKVVRNGEPLANTEIAVYAGRECRESAVTDDRGMIYITVPGNEPTELRFIVVSDGQLMEASEDIAYETDAVYGTPSEPLLIEMSNATAIQSISLDGISDTVYDLSGRRLPNDSKKKGIYIVNKQKQVVK